MTKKIFVCDGKHEKEVQRSDKGVGWFSVFARAADPVLEIKPFSTDADEHYCGEACLIKRVSAFLEEIARKEPTPWVG